MDINIDQYAQELALALHFAWSDISDRVSARNEKLDRKFARPDILGRHGDQKVAKTERVFKEYEKGDQFYLRSYPARFFIDDADNKHKLSSKLQRRYSGPHTILSGVNPVTYKAIVNGKVRTVNAHNMKRDLPAPKTLHEIPDFHEDDDPIDLEEKDQKEEKEIDIEPDLLEQNENVEEDDDPIDDYPDEREDAEDENENSEYYNSWTRWIQKESEEAHPRKHPEPRTTACF
jgi:hypothetical protein